MLEISNLTVDYRGTQALDNVWAKLKPGEITGLIGPNGAGKSTLIKAMLGLIPLRTGQVCWCGQALHRHRHQVAYVPQRSQIDFDYPITAWGVVALGVGQRWLGWSLGGPARQRVEAALRRVDLWDLHQRQIGELSGGQQQRVFLARALAQEADILLLDEPFTGVDKATEAAIVTILEELKSLGKIILVCSHEWGEQLQRYDRLLLLNRSVIANDVPEAVLTLDNIQRAYGQHLHLHSGPEMPAFC